MKYLEKDKTNFYKAAITHLLTLPLMVMVATKLGLDRFAGSDVSGAPWSGMFVPRLYARPVMCRSPVRRHTKHKWIYYKDTDVKL